MNMMRLAAVCVIAAASFFTVSAQPPTGADAKPADNETKALASLKGTTIGKIVWSSSRSASNHDLWIMNADGTDPKQLTKGDNVDWFPRFSPDGSTIIFTRSKGGWVTENDAEYNDKWDLWTIGVDGSNEKKVVDNACWGNWSPDGKSIVFARRTQAFIRDIASGAETNVLDGDVSMKKGTIVQQPQLSPDGKYLAATLRGSSRETGIWNIATKTWVKTGLGCQVNWTPAGTEVYYVNQTGNGGTAQPSEILILKVADGKPTQDITKVKDLKLMDLPGRRSHEYFPKFDNTGEYLIWCATDKGHDHDIYDYEIYLWKRGAKIDSATRLTFHTGNDRWPDIFIQK
ncbi:MAG: PD40 domain-containing protein [Chitinivibrionales bacterium]|nr:PD40 domain-containing protein [Chitinivibrionales bacterium]